MTAPPSYPHYYPETPSTRDPLRFVPLNSSPLASPQTPSKSSPLMQLQARRRSQYKANGVPSTPSKSSSGGGRRSSDSMMMRYARNAQSQGAGGSGSSPSGGTSMSGDKAQKEFLRERFKARCFERATQAREKAVKNKRYAGLGGHPSSDDAPMDEEEEEDDNKIMQDELFRRIMATVKRKEEYAYRVSFDREVGSSFDPDMEDPTIWEESLTSNSADPPHGPPSTSDYPIEPEGPSSSSTSSAGPPPPVASSSYSSYDDLAPEEFDDEELEAYAQDFAQVAAAAEFEGIPLEELFRSDLDDELEEWTRDNQGGETPSLKAREVEPASGSDMHWSEDDYHMMDFA